MKRMNPGLCPHRAALVAGQGAGRLGRGLALAGVLVLGSAAPPAQAALTFTFNYLSEGVGFSDPTYGAARQIALESAAGMLGAYFSRYTATLTFDVTSWSADDGALAAAGSGASVVSGTFQQTIVQTKIISNGTSDPNGASADGSIYWNFFYDWGLSDSPTEAQYDFKSTAMHELLHAFGFASFIGEDGIGLDGKLPGTADTWSTYDRWLTDVDGAFLIASDTGIFDADQVGTLTGGSSVLFSGPNAMAANDGNGIPVYSPTTWEGGSSIAHLDDESPVTSTSLMNAYAHNMGLDVRTLSALELGVLKDMGYTLVESQVPTPAPVWLVGGGLLALLGLRRRAACT